MVISEKPLNPTTMPIIKYDQELTNKQYDKVMEEALTFVIKKNSDYGSSWTIMRPTSLTDQIYAKLLRIRSIQEAGKQLVQDSLRDEFLGVLNYSIMALSILKPNVASSFDLTKERLQELFSAAIAEARALMQKKNHDYGEAFRAVRISALVDMMLMKALRLKSIESNDGRVQVSEGVEANYYDILNYATFCLIRIDNDKIDPRK